MGEPNDPCFKPASPYTVWTVTSTTTTSSPVEQDFFILPASGAPCPVISFDSEDDSWQNPDLVPEGTNTFICHSEAYSPNPCILEVDKYLRVADINIDTNRCRRYKLVLTNEAMIIGSNSANFNGKAIWGTSHISMPTTVGSNGRSSFYGTFDQTGLVWEFVDSPIIGYNVVMSNTYSITGTINVGGPSPRLWPTSVGNDERFGFRIASLFNPLNLANFVTVGDIGNSDYYDTLTTSYYGRVDYVYQISKYPVTNCEYADFLNSVDPEGINPSDIYYFGMGANQRGGIRFVSDNANGEKYVIKFNMHNKPVINILYSMAMRYCNWLHNGKQSYATTADAANARNTGAYNVTGTFKASKQPGANYHIPTDSEWHKAGFYKGGGTNAGYWRFATQSDIYPTSVTANSTGDGLINGQPANISEYTCPSE